METLKSKLWLPVWALLPVVTQAGVMWDEAEDGDLSNDQNAPTVVVFNDASTADTVAGTVGGADPGEFNDVLTFDLFHGFCLDRMVLTAYTAANGNDTSGFNFYAGDVVDNGNPLSAIAAGETDVNSDLLLDSQGQALPDLAAGMYTLNVRDNTAGQAYEVNFVLCQDAVWNEAFDGDFSNNGTSPTGITVTTGRNKVSGIVGGENPGEFQDLFTFVVPNGSALTGLELNNYWVAGGNTSTGINLYVGETNTGERVFFTDLTEALIGTDILTDDYAAGTYTIDLREAEPGQWYGLTLVIEASDLIFADNFE